MHRLVFVHVFVAVTRVEIFVRQFKILVRQTCVLQNPPKFSSILFVSDDFSEGTVSFACRWLQAWYLALINQSCVCVFEFVKSNVRLALSSDSVIENIDF